MIKGAQSSIRLGLFGLLSTILGCSTYRFEEALRPDGKYDLKNMRLGLEEKSGEPLLEFSWIPLVALNLTIFINEGISSIGENPASVVPVSKLLSYPDGQRFSQFHSYGPLSMYQEGVEAHFSPAGEGYEVLERREIFLSLWNQTRSLVKTPLGTRQETRQELLLGLLPVYHRIHYFPAERLPASAPVSADGP